MTRVYLGLGSNINREYHIGEALDALAANFGALTVSPVYESEAVGFKGADFFNCVVGLDTALSVADVNQRLREIEDANGRVRTGPKFGPRTLDIDILVFGELVGTVSGVVLPRDEIVKNAFVLLPLSQIAGAVLHPTVQKSFAALWADYDKSAQVLWPVPFHWKAPST